MMPSAFPRVLGAAALLAYPAHSHFMVLSPASRSFNWSPWAGRDGATFDDIDVNPFAYNSGGIQRVKDRAKDKVSKSVLDRYVPADQGNSDDGQDFWPPYHEDRAPNGNMIEPDDIAERHSICGDPRLGAGDGFMPYSIETDNFEVVSTFISGQVVEMDIVIASWHGGHIEMSICDTGGSNGVPTQECFNKYPLDRAMSDGDASPIDSNYPGRYYVDPPCRGEKGEVDQDFYKEDLRDVGTTTPYRMFARFRLPDGLTCSRCILQAKYFTAHTCKYPGYDEFNPPSWPSACAPNKDDWFYQDAPNDELCGTTPRSYPEEFLQCSDIEIVSSGGDDTEDEEEAEPVVVEEEEEAEPVVVEEEEEADERKSEESTTTTTTTEESSSEEKEYSFIYHGCVADDKADRVMEHMILADELEDKMNAELCMEICDGYKFSGTQWGKQCFCGGEDTNHLLHGESEDCDMPCTGDENETCGGFDAMEVREFT